VRGRQRRGEGREEALRGLKEVLTMSPVGTESGGGGPATLRRTAAAMGLEVIAEEALRCLGVDGERLGRKAGR
jgi:hypothetical protein